MTEEILAEIYENEGQTGVDNALNFEECFDVWEEECEL